MANLEKIRFCSNLMREPQAFDRLGNVAGAIARDLTIWTAWNGATWAVLNLPEFCREFGYKPQHLLKPISAAQQKELIDFGCLEEDVRRFKGKRGGGPLSTYVGYTLAKMALQNLIFAKPDKQVVDLQGDLAREHRYAFLQLIKNIAITSSAKGTTLSFSANKQVLHNCKTWYQTFDLNEYKSLVTATGQADDQARKMYLRLVWKRKYWDKAKKIQGVNPSEDSYEMLKAVAGLNYSREKTNACKLRALLNRIGALETVSMTATVTNCPMTEQYQVKFKRTRTEA